MNGCELCPGACDGARLAALTTPELAWLWEQIAVRADKSGDRALASGRLDVTVPTEPRQAAAVGRLVTPRPPLGGTRIRADMARLAANLRVHGPLLTPAAVAAHALHRPLGLAAQERQAARERTRSLTDLVRTRLIGLPTTARVRPEPESALAALRSGRWLHRLASDTWGEELVELAIRALAALPPPGERIDRRVLAQRLTGSPKALDRGSLLAGLVLALGAAGGAVADTRDQRGAWDGLGVDYDQLTGGLLCLNVLPDGWLLPADEPVTVTPHTLARCRWTPPPDPEGWVFVTENPSVVAAILDLAPLPRRARLVCTNGTPSAVEVAAIARLADAGWRIAVRADFDVAGLHHVSAITTAQPAAVPWRMAADNYRDSLSAGGGGRWTYPLDTDHLPPTPWSPALEVAMRRHRRPGYEEGLLDALLEDVLTGHPPQAAPAPPPRHS